MTNYVLSIDGACTGRRSVCAAVIASDGTVVAEGSRDLPQVDGYVLAAEIAGVALAGELLGQTHGSCDLTVETDNPDVPKVIEGHYRPKQFSRIPPELLETARALCRNHCVTFMPLRRMSTPGLQRADKLARQRLWRKRR
jgi:ribonuclease HI